MADADARRMKRTCKAMPLPDEVALVLQGGGALGAYQAGAYARLHEAGMVPAHVAGTSIGAINAAIIAGNTPERRVEHLRIFWERVTAATDWPIPPSGLFAAELSALWGVPGFFSPRVPPATFAPFGNPGRASYYDTAPLRQTLCELVNFDLLNKGPVRLSVSAVEVATGNFSWFDTMHQRLEPEHIMASGALPPGSPRKTQWKTISPANPLSQRVPHPKCFPFC